MDESPCQFCLLWFNFLMPRVCARIWRHFVCELSQNIITRWNLALYSATMQSHTSNFCKIYHDIKIYFCFQRWTTLSICNGKYIGYIEGHRLAIDIVLWQSIERIKNKFLHKFQNGCSTLFYLYLFKRWYSFSWQGVLWPCAKFHNSYLQMICKQNERSIFF